MAGAGARMSGIGEMWRYKRVLTASLVGTAVEFYDFYIYATAASLIFPSLFFPSSSPTAQLMASYGSLALAFFARRDQKSVPVILWGAAPRVLGALAVSKHPIRE